MLLQPCLTDSNINCTPLRPQVNSCGLSGWFQEVRNSNAGTSASWLHHGEAGTGWVIGAPAEMNVVQEWGDSPKYQVFFYGENDDKPSTSEVPSGNLLHSYWKWQFIVDFPIEKWWFSIAMLVYQRVTLFSETPFWWAYVHHPSSGFGSWSLQFPSTMMQFSLLKSNATQWKVLFCFMVTPLSMDMYIYICDPRPRPTFCVADMFLNALSSFLSDHLL